MRLNVLSLFAGIGGLELGLERAGMTVVGQVEIDPFCRRVLAKHWPDVPRHDDVRTAVDWWTSERRPRVDVVCGGFPCQDISSAGRRAGIVDGERSSLWSAMADTIRRIRHRYVLVENVPRVLVRGRDGFIPVEIVAADLAAFGYDLRWDCVPASALGAPHRRDRWFGIAYPHGDEWRLQPVAEPRRGGSAIPGDDGPAQPLAYADDKGCGRGAELPSRRNALPPGGWLWPDPDGRCAAHLAVADVSRLPHRDAEPSRPDGRGEGPERRGGGRTGSQWATEPRVGRVVDGLSNRLDRAARIRALGNAVVPQVAEYVGRLIVAHAEGVAA